MNDFETAAAKQAAAVSNAIVIAAVAGFHSVLPTIKYNLVYTVNSRILPALDLNPILLITRSFKINSILSYMNRIPISTTMNWQHWFHFYYYSKTRLLTLP